MLHCRTLSKYCKLELINFTKLRLLFHFLNRLKVLRVALNRFDLRLIMEKIKINLYLIKKHLVTENSYLINLKVLKGSIIVCLLFIF